MVGEHTHGSEVAHVGIVEVGSTVTKAYRASLMGVEAVALTGIEFKKNSRTSGILAEDDIQDLLKCVRDALPEAGNVWVYGTSIFRDLDESQPARVADALSALGDVHFEVVSAEQEALLTAEGAIASISFDGNIGVLIGGGGSTEVVGFAGDQLLGVAESSLGVGDVNLAFPDLCEEVAVSGVDEVTEWIRGRLAVPNFAAGLLVLAGGDFPLLYENAGYSLSVNPYTADPEKRHLITVPEKRSGDEVFFHHLALSSFEHLTPDAPNWWKGARAMCCVVNAVASQLGCQLLVPTRVSMVYGIARRLLA